MLVWLVPVCVFFPIVALYLGGMRTEPANGSGFQQVIGLVITMALFMALWAVLRTVLDAPLGARLGGVVVPTVAAVLAMPLEVRVGYLLVGVRLKRVAAH
jgi:hypothetical protein